MKRFLAIILTAALTLVLAVLTLWAGLGLWLRLPLPEIGRMIAAGAFGLFGLAVIVALFGKRPIRALAIYALAFAAVLLWWQTIKPPLDGDWAPGVARQVTGVIQGDILTLTNMREFEWQSEEEFSEIWTMRHFDLSQIETLDMFITYWEGPKMAHILLSFGFGDDEHLVWSVEARREADSQFHPIWDFFKSHTRVNIASVETDVVGLRAMRGDDVKLYRLNTSPELARVLVEEFVRDSNALAQEPQFFNSLTKNCTTAIAEMLQAVGVHVPFDWRLIANGYTPYLVYQRGAMDTRHTLAELRELGRINTRAEADGRTSGFSAAVREGVPVPER